MEIFAYLIIGLIAIAPGIVITVLRKEFNWRNSVHWIIPVGLPSLIGIIITINFIFTSHDDSQMAFGLAALIMISIPFAALYGVTVWLAGKYIASKKQMD